MSRQRKRNRGSFAALGCAILLVAGLQGCKRDTYPWPVQEANASEPKKAPSKGTTQVSARPVAAAPRKAVKVVPRKAPAARKVVAKKAPVKLPVEQAVLTYAPQVPPRITRNYPAKVIVKLEAKEVTRRLADGVTYTFWTFGGRVPGKFIRLREGDTVEFHLSNHPKNKMPHNIDMHAVTGPGGGAVSTFTAPGHTSKFTFKALKPGLYVYHCATAPVGMHIANGMYGLILVQPKAGLPKVDREYYIMQSEFYTGGPYGQQGHQPFNMKKAIKEQADYVVFNGSVGSLVGKNAIRAKVGETIRLYVGNGGPNLVSSFHVIGEIFDKVYIEGGFRVNKNVQTTLIPAGGSAMVEFKVEVPGTYILVDHSIFRAFNKGALGMLKVSGKKQPDIYSGKQSDTVYLPEGSGNQSVDEKVKPVVFRTRAEKLLFGKRVFAANCMACHQAHGKGIPHVFPPLAGSDFLLSNPKRAIRIVLGGLKGPIKVKGKTFNGVMPAVNLTDKEVAMVLSYVLNSWGNKGPMITTAEVAKVRKAMKK